MSKYFLGVDGGQSRTAALIGDEHGRVLGIGFAGPCNHAVAAEGRSKFTAAMNTCLEAACADAGLKAGVIRFSCACLGFSGGPRDKEEILNVILSSDRIVVTHDALIALAGATVGEPGVITIAGTGSIAFGRNAAGQTSRAGGWGYIFGDEGGGFWIVRQALRAALGAEEGWGRSTLLRDALLQATGVVDANELLHRFYTVEYPRSRIAGLAPLVDEAADRGDPYAREILQDAAEELARIALAVSSHLFRRGEPVRFTHAGGVFRSNIVLKAFADSIQRETGQTVQTPVYGPAAGALLEAYRIARVECSLADVPEEKATQY